VDSENRAAAVAQMLDPDLWRDVFEDLWTRLCPRFARVEPRRAARDLLVGLLAPIERKNSWWLAEHAGHATPDRMQRLLRDVVFDHQRAGGDLREFVAEHLGHDQGVLIADETGFLKKGTHSVGVQRQYTGTAGRTENAQVGVFLTYASPRGRALIDRRIYLPASWCDLPERCQAAGIPDDVGFATKPALACDMIAAALDAGINASWVTGDAVYGADPHLAAQLRQRQIGYVLAIAVNRTIQVTPTVKMTAGLAAQGLSHQAWQRYSAGAGSKGDRDHEWAWITDHTVGPGVFSLLIRRHRDGTLAYYRCWSPHPVPFTTLVRVAATRWQVEESFQLSKGLVGLDHYQCRTWTPWHRFTIFAMIAMAIIAVTLALLNGEQPTHPDLNADLIPLTIPELRRLTNALILNPAPHTTPTLTWSNWRRRHQARARRSHYKRHAAAASEP
jgi:SRSO17 transposase